MCRMPYHPRTCVMCGPRFLPGLGRGLGVKTISSKQNLPGDDRCDPRPSRSANGSGRYRNRFGLAAPPARSGCFGEAEKNPRRITGSSCRSRRAASPAPRNEPQTPRTLSVAAPETCQKIGLPGRDDPSVSQKLQPFPVRSRTPPEHIPAQPEASQVRDRLLNRLGTHDRTHHAGWKIAARRR